ncbi:DUF484 family protein [Caulobacter sp. DWR3-1-2]|uniref:DUF484 family protein n=1 Tax=Caulobacter sp. DWR3-1-2 TaxID=2804647 RepID=UPI003CEFDFB1
MTDATQAMSPHPVHADAVRDFLRAEPDFLHRDPDLLSDLGLRANASNVVDFGPLALARAAAAHQREAGVRREIEATARANFSAQAQTHAAVIDLLDARNHSDLARRVDDMAALRFGLAAGVVVLEGPGRVPAGWHALIDGQIDMIMGDHGVARMGFHAPALGLFGDRLDTIKSMALVRLAVWEPSRQGLLAFGSADPDGFSADMGTELVSFLARVVERTAERWPVL